MQSLKLSYTFILLVLVCGTASAQYYADFPSLIYPRSIISGGLGEQGVASRNPLEAMQYNPATLVYADGISASFFRNPWNIIGSFNGGLPVTVISLSGKAGDFGSVGLEYTYWNLGDVPLTTPQGPDVTGVFRFYEQSFAGTYAYSLSDQFALGGQVRYARKSRYRQSSIEHLFFSAGVTYRPESFSDRITIGASLMNFGTSVDYGSIVDTINGQPMEFSESSPPPAQLNIGLEGLAATSNFFDISVAVGVTKPFAKVGGPPDHKAESSFSSLFTNWNNFPEDVTAQLGVGLIWHPIELAPGLSYFQEMYIGHFSTGPKNLYDNFYTHGFRIGLRAYGVQATAGYAGRWHNNNAGPSLPWEFPWETFQFTLKTEERLFGIRDESTKSGETVHGIVLAGGYSYGLEVGRMKETTLGGATKISFSMKNIWSVESEFPIDDNSALISSFGYSRLTERAEIRSPIFPFSSVAVIEFDIEMLSFESGFRYHPLESFQPFFIQGSVGVVRLKPLGVLTIPKYSYKTFDVLAAGCVVPMMESGIVVVPQVGLKTFFMEESITSGRLLGYNHLEFGLRVGYKF